MKLKLIIFAIFALLAFVAYQKYTEYSSLRSIDSYESCVSAKGSVVQESYPATCITRLGVRFTQPLTFTQQVELISPASTSNWQTYTDTTHNYIISYPATWKEENNPNVAQTNIIGREMSVSITWSQHAADTGNAGGCLSPCNFTGPDGSYNWTILKQEPDTKNNTGLIIRANISSDNSTNRSLVDQILSTFKFTN